MLVPAAQIVALLAYVGGPLMQLHVPEPANLKITIADQVTTVANGTEVRYELTVTNSGDTEAPLIIKLHLSSGVIRDLRADDAAVVANAVAWKRSLRAGESQTYAAGGMIERASDLAATACIHLAADQPAITCVTDLNAATESGERRAAWLAAIVLGLLAVAGSVWLQKKITPEPLTPANAGAAFKDLPGQPGGTPSV